MTYADLVERHASKYGVINVWECSNCGHTFEEVNGIYPYCPFCRKRIVEGRLHIIPLQGIGSNKGSKECV